MTLTIAVLAPGAMGSAVARRLKDHGARVLTQLAGRSQATVERAAAAGMIAASDTEIAAADIILSIVPPGEAVALAERLAGVIATGSKKPVYVDCNAVNVETVEKIARIIAPSGASFVDAGIIGPPPRPGSKGTVFYISGASAREVVGLGDLGLDLRLIDGPVGAASALKMSYAGINKGFVALGTAIALAATRAGAEPALRAELAASQPQMLARLERALPDMIPKAYRWVAEMREISGFLGPDDPASLIFEGCARLFEHIAKEKEAGGEDIARIIAFAEGARVRIDA
jgi:3-hydroxyisobutyrate dehydrogenase-like beta-hydroxyacid dehydrogenase